MSLGDRVSPRHTSHVISAVVTWPGPHTWALALVPVTVGAGATPALHVLSPSVRGPVHCVILCFSPGQSRECVHDPVSRCLMLSGRKPLPDPLPQDRGDRRLPLSPLGLPNSVPVFWSPWPSSGP